MTLDQQVKPETAKSEIATVDDLLKSLQDDIIFDTDKKESFKAYITEKFGLETKDQIISITQAELIELKAKLSTATNQQDVLGDFIYEDYLETQLEGGKGIENIDVDDIFTGIESEKILQIKGYIEKDLQVLFQGNNFLSPEQKKLISLSVMKDVLSSTNKILMFLKELIPQKAEVTNVSTEVANLTMDTTTKVSSILHTQGLTESVSEYKESLTLVSEFLEAQNPKLSEEDKAKLMASIDWYSGRENIPTILKDFDVDNIGEAVFVDMKELTEDLVAMRGDVESMMKKSETQLYLKEKLLKLSQNPLTQEALKKLFNIPILGKILALLLGMDGDNPGDSFEKESNRYKVYDSLVSQGISTDKDKVEKSGKGIFEKIDFSEQNFEENKEIILEIQKITGITDKKKLGDFWQQAFSKEGFSVDGIVLKFGGLGESTNNEGGKLKKGGLKDILESGVSEYKTNKEVEEKKEIEKKKEEARVAEEHKKVLDYTNKSIGI